MVQLLTNQVIFMWNGLFNLELGLFFLTVRKSVHYDQIYTQSTYYGQQEVSHPQAQETDSLLATHE